MGTKAMIKLRDRSGVALVIALIMIVVLTLIGLSSTFTSVFETKLSGTKRESTSAYYATDAAAQAVFNNNGNFDPDPSDVPITDAPAQLPPDLRGEPVDRYRPYTNTIINLPSGTAFADPPQVTIFHLRREGGEGAQYKWNPYIIGAVGRDQIISIGLMKSQCTVRQKWIMRSVSEEEGG
jgi:hypothetical protein